MNSSCRQPLVFSKSASEASLSKWLAYLRNRLSSASLMPMSPIQDLRRLRRRLCYRQWTSQFKTDSKFSTFHLALLGPPNSSRSPLGSLELQTAWPKFLDGSLPSISSEHALSPLAIDEIFR